MYFLDNFQKIAELQISRKSVRWEPLGYMRTDRQREGQAGGWTDRRDEANRRFSQLTRKQLNTLIIKGRNSLPVTLAKLLTRVLNSWPSGRCFCRRKWHKWPILWVQWATNKVVWMQRLLVLGWRQYVGHGWQRTFYLACSVAAKIYYA